MDVTLTSGDAMKLTNKFFVHIQPKGKDVIHEGGKYNAVCDEYGRLGVVECVNCWTGNAHMVKPTALLVAEGLPGYLDYASKKGIKQMDMVQVCTFRFIRRNDEAFEKLIKEQTRRQGLSIFSQQTIF